jgi:hypothetical protein
VQDLVVSDEGELELLRLDLKAVLVTPRIWHLRCYVNDYFPNRDITLASLTAVSYWGGTFTEFVTPPGGTTVFGFYVTFNNGAKLLYAQRLDAPVVGGSGLPVRVWPTMTGHSESQPPP